MTRWLIGDLAFLVPTLATAPGVAYRQPQCRVLALTSTRVEVELSDGTRLWTSLRNLAKRPLRPEPARPTPPQSGRRLVLADGEQEVPLW